MPSVPDQGTYYGNLQSYKYYIRPAAQRLFGSTSVRTRKPIIKHHQNVHRLLKLFALNGTLTTWDMAKIRFPNDISKIRTKEKEYRRLLIGRKDRGKQSDGILQVGLVVKDGKSFKKAPADLYRLSLHGILYCFEVLNLNNQEIDILASKYAKVLPKVFGKWDYLKSNLGDEIYKLKILAKGLLLDNPLIVKDTNVPFYELMSFLNIKYRRNFEFISEQDLADQISYWFYTNLLYYPILQSDKKKWTLRKRKLQHIFQEDEELRKWYFDFFQEAKRFYMKRVQMLKGSAFLRRKFKHAF